MTADLTALESAERTRDRETGEVGVGDDISTVSTRWSFAGGTPQKFDTHVSKSVPLYAEGHELINRCIEFFCRRGGTIIDVGCSTGTLLERLARKECCQDMSLIGFDIEPDMVRVARQRCMDLENVTIRQGELQSVDYSGVNAVIMYYTLQFLPPGERQHALKQVCDGLVEGGALLLFEKTLEPDSRTQDIVQQLYAEYKLDNGFDAEEVYRKAHSLRSVMASQRSADTHDLLGKVGFTSVVTIQKYLHFEGILAIK
ncbi:methyltransferase domain-containing protein [Streptomyces sp. G2]|uniref:methyltransferase domain-containing protein n=1 Tax=Streptomyces TaxID=1883 RepID=UPI00202FBBA7|nr:methyltransferase domain-containing protein [Streptomyces sp. G2]MCM1951398.1 methyltransferase domain-containing protein [Streptomyces sp. G2]